LRVAGRISRELRERTRTKKYRADSRLDLKSQITIHKSYGGPFAQTTICIHVSRTTHRFVTHTELRQLDALFSLARAQEVSGIASLLRYMPILVASLHKSHPDISSEQIENSLTLEDFNALFSGMLEVSGLKKASAGEATPVLV
jgi:hypothetical protein